MVRRTTHEVRPVVVYGGASSQRRKPVLVLSWSDIDRFDWVSGRLASG